jgi:hypothetical protein
MGGDVFLTAKAAKVENCALTEGNEGNQGSSRASFASV